MEEKYYTDLAVKLESVNARSKSNELRIDDCEAELKDIKTEQKAIYKIANSVENLAASMSGLQNDVGEIKTGQRELNEKVNTLENQPAQATKKRLDTLYDKLVWLFVSALAGFLLARLVPFLF